MPTMFRKDGSEVLVDKTQVSLMKDAGCSHEKPSAKVEESPEVVLGVDQDPADPANTETVAAANAVETVETEESTESAKAALKKKTL